MEGMLINTLCLISLLSFSVLFLGTTRISTGLRIFARTARKLYISVFLLLGVAIIIVMYSSSRPSEREMTLLQASSIIAALDQYKNNHLVYPDNLSHLVPEYVAAIEKPAVSPEGAEWLYESSDEQYTLGYWSEGFLIYGPIICVYSSRVPAWECCMRRTERCPQLPSSMLTPDV
jgi:hypothetical protein